jgi:hypothetical protein
MEFSFESKVSLKEVTPTVSRENKNGMVPAINPGFLILISFFKNDFSFIILFHLSSHRSFNDLQFAFH